MIAKKLKRKNLVFNYKGCSELGFVSEIPVVLKVTREKQYKAPAADEQSQ